MSDRRVWDIDIDVNSKCDRGQYGTRAMIYNDSVEKVLPHPSGVYLEDVPIDHMTGNCAFDHKLGDEQGFMKIDLLTNTSYDRFRSKQDLLDSIDAEPDWDMLLSEEVVASLPHIGKHYDVVARIKPDSTEALADVLALIRPGKIHYLENYIQHPKAIRRELYRKPANGKPYFKKSHAISYALMIVAIINKMKNPGHFIW